MQRLGLSKVMALVDGEEHACFKLSFKLLIVPHPTTFGYWMSLTTNKGSAY